MIFLLHVVFKLPLEKAFAIGIICDMIIMYALTNLA